MLSLTAWPGLRGLGSLKTREGAARISTGIANTRRKLTLAGSSSTGPAHAWCAAGGKGGPGARSWRWPRAPSRVPTTTHLANRIPSPQPAPSPPATQAGRADTRAQGPGGQAAGVAREQASERASGGSGSGSRSGGEAGVPRFGSSRWRPSCRSHPSPASRGGGSGGGFRALVRAGAHGVAWSRRARGRESESGGGRKIKTRKEMCLACLGLVGPCPSVGFGLSWALGLRRRRPDRARRAQAGLVAGVA